MGLSTYYLALPRRVVKAIVADASARLVLQSLWRQGAGAWTALQEFERSELLQYLGDGGFDEDQAEGALDCFERIVAEAAAAGVAGTSAYVEKTHDLHEAMLRNSFRERGFAEAEELASIAIGGPREVETIGEELWCTPEDAVRRVGDAVRALDVDRALKALPGLGAELTDTLDWMSSVERHAHLEARAHDLELRRELAQLCGLYAEAGALGHVVLMG
jgi:hypothetical protein